MVGAQELTRSADSESCSSSDGATSESACDDASRRSPHRSRRGHQGRSRREKHQVLLRLPPRTKEHSPVPWYLLPSLHSPSPPFPFSPSPPPSTPLLLPRQWTFQTSAENFDQDFPFRAKEHSRNGTSKTHVPCCTAALPMKLWTFQDPVCVCLHTWASLGTSGAHTQAPMHPSLKVTGCVVLKGLSLIRMGFRLTFWRMKQKCF